MISDYIQVAIVILLAFLIKRIVSKYVTKILFKFGKGRWSGLSLNELDTILITPIERFFMILVIIIAFDRLTFPNALLFKIHTLSSRTIVDSIVKGLVIYGFASLLTHTMDFIAIVIKRKSVTKSRGEHQLLYFFKDFIKVVIIIFAVVFIIKYSLHANVGKLLTGLSIVGAALALAARESLENLIASFVIFFDRPFVTGDTVKIRDVRGAVERIGLRSTRIRTIENSLVTVPNKQMVDSILDNFSSRSLVRNEATISIPSKYTAATIKKIISQMQSSLIKLEQVQEVNVFLREITGDNAIVSVTYYTKLSLSLAQSNSLREDLNIALKSVLDDYASTNSPKAS